MTQGLTQMVDLLPPATAIHSSTPDWLVVVAILGIALGSGCWLLWRFRSNPIRRIRTQLQAAQLTPRQALHALAKLKPSPELDRLRFRPEEPDLQTVNRLLKGGAEHD